MKTVSSNPQPDLAVAVGTATPLPVAERQPSETERMFAMIERMATDPQVDPAKLREILSVKQAWEADEARKAFSRDMAVFQTECPIISKADSANGKMYAKIDRIHRETRELRKKCGFWFTWASVEISANVAKLEGLLGHSGGHTIPIKQVIPLPEEIVSGSGKLAQNSSQRAGSAMTYAKRYGECLALDIVTGEDFDGNVPKQRPAGPATAQQASAASATPAPEHPSAGQAMTDREARAELWARLKAHDGTLTATASWDAAKEFLLNNDILKAGEKITALPVARLLEIIAATNKLLNP